MKLWKKIAAASTAAIAGLLAAGIAFGQVTIPLIATLGPSGIMQVLPNRSPTVGNYYASRDQLLAWIFGANTGHTGTPSISSCGGGTPTIAGNDMAFHVTQGTSATGCTVQFAQAFTATPTCVAVNQTAPGTSTPAYSVTTSGVTLVTASTSGEIWDVVCVAPSGG